MYSFRKKRQLFEQTNPNVDLVLRCHGYDAEFAPPCVCRRIDCAGILKLRNSDIELRKGETDIGRKNTRVRLVFRVHIAQPNGRTVSLQTASNPIECCKYESPLRNLAFSPGFPFGQKVASIVIIQ